MNNEDKYKRIIEGLIHGNIAPCDICTRACRAHKYYEMMCYENNYDKWELDDDPNNTDNQTHSRD